MDHQALRWLYSLREPKDRIARWLETLSAYQFSIEYSSGHKHGNADAMSWRCPNPQECKCPLLEEEVLKFGPCWKCHRRAVTMDSVFMDTQGNQKSMQAQCSDPRCMVWTHSQTKGLQACDSEGNATALAAKGRNRTKYGRMGCCRGNPGKKLPTGGGRGVPRTEVGTQASSSHPDWPDAEPAPSGEKPWALPYSMQDLKKKQMEDLDIGPVMRWLEKGVRLVGPKLAASSPTTQHYWLHTESLKLIDGVLFHRFSRKDGTGEHTQLIVPRKLKDEIGHQMHSSLLSGHLCKCKTMEWVIQHFYWFGVREDCDLWVERCDICVSVKKPPQKPQAPLSQCLWGHQWTGWQQISWVPFHSHQEGIDTSCWSQTTLLSGWKSLQYQIRLLLHVQRSY